MKSNPVPIILIVLVFSFQIIAQVSPPPSKESFTPAFGRISDGTTLPTRRDTDTVKIYNADGSLWYEFSYYESSPLFHKIHTKPDFDPINPVPNFGMRLQLKAESENWYEVVVNEETGLTKYTWKKDPILERKLWEQCIESTPYVTLDKKNNPLRISPNGELAEEQLPEEQIYFAPVIGSEIKGEWLRIWTGWSEYVEEPIDGWIRWRDGNKLLIGFKAYRENKLKQAQQKNTVTAKLSFDEGEEQR